MIRIIAEIYSFIHRIMIVVGTVTLAVVGGILGNKYWYEIRAIANTLFKWNLTQQNSTFIGVLIGLFIAFAFYGREAMILETYKAAKN